MLDVPLKKEERHREYREGSSILRTKGSPKVRNLVGFVYDTSGMFGWM